MCLPIKTSGSSLMCLPIKTTPVPCPGYASASTEHPKTMVIVKGATHIEI